MIRYTPSRSLGEIVHRRALSDGSDSLPAVVVVVLSSASSSNVGLLKLLGITIGFASDAEADGVNRRLPGLA